MRLLKLRLQAFGPYEDGEIVDFRTLRFSRLFLIHGPVGSGKTYLLDGICFALYGRSSGGERERRELRSVSAPPERDTAVALDFEIQAQSYRVERRFSVEGGDDEVAVWRLPEYGEPTQRDLLSSSNSGAEAMVTRLFGLTAEQFCQVAILPQGRFRAFLLAEGEQRREILSSIFNSSRHAKLQRALGLAGQKAKEQLEAAWQRREELTSRYSVSGGDPRETFQRSQEELNTVARDCDRHQERSQEWEHSLEDAVRYEVLDRQRVMSERELHLLQNDEEEDEEVLLAARLRECLPLYEKWRKLQSEMEDIFESLQEQRTQYESLKSNSNLFEDEIEQARRLEEERFNLKRSVERLDILIEDYRGVEALSEELDRTRVRLDELGDARAETANVVKASRAEMKELEEELAKIKEGEARLSKLKADLHAVERQRGRVRQSRALRDTFAQAQARVEKFEDIVLELEASRKLIKESITKKSKQEEENALILLSRKLKKDESCPLCGSEEHPDPWEGRKRRRRTEDVDDELESVERRLELARNELSQARERIARLEGRLEERSEEDAIAPELDDRTLNTLRSTVQAVESRVSQKDQLLRRLRKLREEAKPARVKLKKMRLLKERLDSTIEAIEGQYESRKRAVLQTMREFFSEFEEASFEELVEFIDSEKIRLEERLSDIDQVTFSTERAELMAETFALQLAETRALEMRRDSMQREADALRDDLVDEFRLQFSGWEDLSFSLSRMARESSLTGQATVLDRETLIRTVERQLNQSQELLSTMPEPDMKAEQIRQVLAREREQLELKIGRKAALEKSIEQSREDVKRYDTLVEEIRALESRHKNLGRMATLAAGDDGPDFHSWYLERLFRKVLDAANLRLEILAPNRFCLGLEEGLEVRVVDFLAGKNRSAITLSGGESFLASLALALGLGDILQGEREARERLQTLFIDEGFGYLDKRALEAALDCLESLKQEGRTVGIISHVPALRERIRAQVVIAPNDTPLPYGVDRIQVLAD